MKKKKIIKQIKKKKIAPKKKRHKGPKHFTVRQLEKELERIEKKLDELENLK